MTLRKRTALALAVAALAAGGLGACNSDDAPSTNDVNDAINNAQDTIDKATQDAQDKANQAAGDVQDKADQAKDDANKQIDKAQNEVGGDKGSGGY